VRGDAWRRNVGQSSSGASLAQISTGRAGAESGGAGGASSRCRQWGESRHEQGAVGDRCGIGQEELTTGVATEQTGAGGFHGFFQAEHFRI
jgi:hypothetical protein